MSVTATKDLKNALQVLHALRPRGELSWNFTSATPVCACAAALIYRPSAVCGMCSCTETAFDSQTTSRRSKATAPRCGCRCGWFVCALAIPRMLIATRTAMLSAPGFCRWRPGAQILRGEPGPYGPKSHRDGEGSVRPHPPLPLLLPCQLETQDNSEMSSLMSRRWSGGASSKQCIAIVSLAQYTRLPF